MNATSPHYVLVKQRCREEFVGVLRTYVKRQNAILSCYNSPVVAAKGDEQPMNIQLLIQQLKTIRHKEKTYRSGEEVSTYEACHSAVADLRHVLYQMDASWRIHGEPFHCFEPGEQSLDWYLLENLSSSQLVERHGLTASQIQQLCRTIYTFWVRSRISIGEAVGVLAVQSCFSEVTQNYLDSKHGGKTVISELTRGAKLWINLISGRMTDKDHVLTTMIRFFDDSEDRKWMERVTGQTVIDSTSNGSLFEHTPLEKIMLFCDYQSCQPFRHRSDLSAHWRGDGWQMVNVFSTSPSATLYHIEKPRKHRWEWRSGYVRMIWDMKLCEEQKIDWQHILRQFRKMIPSVFYLDSRSHALDQKLEIHIYKRQLKVTCSGSKPASSAAPLSPESLWGQTSIQSNLSKLKLPPGAHVHVLESESMCLVKYMIHTLHFVYQSGTAKYVEVKPLLPYTDVVLSPLSFPPHTAIPISSQLAHKKEEGREDEEKEKAASFRQIEINFQSETKDSNDVLYEIFRFMQRLDVCAERVKLINPKHSEFFFGQFAGARTLSSQMEACLLDANVSTNWRHARLAADSLSFRGKLIFLNSEISKRLHEDMLTRVSNRENYKELNMSARKSTFSNPNSSATHRHISTSYTVGTAVWEGCLDKGELLRESRMESEGQRKMIPMDSLHHLISNISEGTIPLHFLHHNKGDSKLYSAASNSVFYPFDLLNEKLDKIICTSVP